MLIPVRKYVCYMCDKTTATLNADGWCEGCVQEFEVIKQRNRWTCRNGVCETPVTCAIKKGCTAKAVVSDPDSI